MTPCRTGDIVNSEHEEMPIMPKHAGTSGTAARLLGTNTRPGKL
jgi:hypothetical protein